MAQAVQNIVNVNQNIFEFDKGIITNIIESYLNDMNQYIKENLNNMISFYKNIKAG